MPNFEVWPLIEGKCSLEDGAYSDLKFGSAALIRGQTLSRGNKVYQFFTHVTLARFFTN